MAAGRFDGVWQRGLQVGDVAAGAVLVREAGGYISDADRGDLSANPTSVVAGNEYMHRAIQTVLKEK